MFWYKSSNFCCFNVSFLVGLTQNIEVITKTMEVIKIENNKHRRHTIHIITSYIYHTCICNSQSPHKQLQHKQPIGTPKVKKPIKH